MTELNEMIRVARGDAPADIVLRNAKLVNVYSGEIYPADVAIHNARIAGIGSDYHGTEEIDLTGSYLAPGLIDAHVHIESAMVGVRQFAGAVVPRGVTSVIADPHEITNVLGLDGIGSLLDFSLLLFVRLQEGVLAQLSEHNDTQLKLDGLHILLCFLYCVEQLFFDFRHFN